MAKRQITIDADSWTTKAHAVKKERQAEVGAIPPPKNPRRRKRCEKDLGKYLRTYFPHLFYRPFSPDHEEVIRRAEKAAIEGGLFCISMWRGAGKTTIAEGIAMWATSYGHRKFPVVVGSNKKAADTIIKDIKAEWETNDMLLEDFPEIAIPVRHLHGRAQRCATQTYKGELTRIEWKTNELVYPTIDDCASNGCVIEAHGITAGVRGRKRGELRPDFVIIDDPQTRESAESEGQTDQLERIIRGDILGLAGHDKQIAAVMPCTVIKKGDLSDRHLDRTKHPEWQGHRAKLVHSWATNSELWDEYHEVWKEGQASGEGHAPATEFYRANRKRMDEGCVVACEHTYDHKTELSAIQHAYNLYYKSGEEAFEAEYQNEPIFDSAGSYDLTPFIVASRTNGERGNTAPVCADIITGFVDINYVGLHWGLAAWENNHTGYVMNAGKFPEGNAVLVEKNDPLAEPKIYEGLTQLMKRVKATTIMRDGQEASIDLMLIDCGRWMDTVFRWIRMNNRKYPFRIVASRGWGATRYKQTKPIGRPGDGFHFTTFEKKGRVYSHNADLWRMRMQKSFLLEPGSPGSVSLWGDSPARHANFAEHVCGEKLVHYVVDSDGTALYQWEPVVGRKNDLGDVMTGLMVAAGACGASVTPGPPRKKKRAGRKKKKLKF